MIERETHVPAVKRTWAVLGIVIALAMTASAQDGPVAAERLVVKFDHGAFSLLERETLREVLPPSDPAPTLPASGFWYELQSSEGAVRYRRIIGDPVRLVFEGEDSETPGRPILRSEGIPQERIFAVLVPAPASGDRLVLFSSPLRLGAQAEPATEIARLPLETIVK